MKRFTRKRRLALTAVLAIVVAIAGGAFTASNTFSSGSAGNAGDGSASISGFTISNVSYQLQASDPSYIGGVSFSITPAANEVQVSFNPTGGPYYTCSAGLSLTKTCTLPANQQTVVSANNLRVISAS